MSHFKAKFAHLLGSNKQTKIKFDNYHAISDFLSFKESQASQPQKLLEDETSISETEDLNIQQETNQNLNKVCGIYKDPIIEKRELKSIRELFNRIRDMLYNNYSRYTRENINLFRYFKNISEEELYFYGFDEYDNLSRRQNLKTYIEYMKIIEKIGKAVIKKIKQEYSQSKVDDEHFWISYLNEGNDENIVNLLLQRTNHNWSGHHTDNRIQSPYLIQFQNEMIESYKKWMIKYNIVSELRESKTKYKVKKPNLHFQLIEKIMFIKNCQYGGKHFRVTSPEFIRRIELENNMNFSKYGTKLTYEIQKDIPVRVYSEAESEPSDTEDESKPSETEYESDDSQSTISSQFKDNPKISMNSQCFFEDRNGSSVKERRIKFKKYFHIKN